MVEKVVPRYLSSDPWTLVIGIILLITGPIIFLFLSTLVRDYYCCVLYKLNFWCYVIGFKSSGLEGET